MPYWQIKTIKGRNPLYYGIAAFLCLINVQRLI